MPFVDDDSNPRCCRLSRHADEEMAAEIGGEDGSADLYQKTRWSLSPICDPLPQKRHQFAGADTIELQAKKSRTVTIRPPLDSLTTTGRNSSIFSDTGLTQIWN